VTWACTCIANVCPWSTNVALVTGGTRQFAIDPFTGVFIFVSVQDTVAGINRDFQQGACAGLLTTDDVCVNLGVPQRCPGCPKHKSKKSLLLLLLLLLLLIPVLVCSSLCLLLVLCIRRKKTEAPVQFATFDAGPPALAEPVFQPTLQAVPVHHATVHTHTHLGAPGTGIFAPGQF